MLLDDEQRLTELHRLAVLDHDGLILPAFSDSIWFIIFIASMMHSTWPTSTSSPISTNCLAPGVGRGVVGAHHGRGDDVLADAARSGPGLGGCRGRRRASLRQGRGARRSQWPAHRRCDIVVGGWIRAARAQCAASPRLP